MSVKMFILLIANFISQLISHACVLKEKLNSFIIHGRFMQPISTGNNLLISPQVMELPDHNITNATNAVVTAPNHGLVSGTTVILNNVAGMTEVNGNAYTIAVIDVNDFSIGVNSTTFAAYTSGGSWYSSPYNGFTTAFPFIPSVNNDPGPQNSRNLFFPQSRVQNILITANVIGANGVGQETPLLIIRRGRFLV